MRLVKIHYRNPALDTQFSYCINNRLWRKDKVQILNDKEMLVPKYYSARHVGTIPAQKRANARYRAKNPLKFIKKVHEEKQRKPKPKHKKKVEKSNRIYTFKVNVSEIEYKLLWNFLYKDIRDPLTDKIRIQTIEEIIEKQRKENNNDIKS